VLPRGLTGRIVIAFALLAFTILVAVWFSVFVTLRDLERKQTWTRLGDVADGLLSQIRESLLDAPQRAEVVSYAERLEAQGIEVYVATADGRLRTLGGVPVVTEPIDVGATRGDVRKGDATIDNGRVLYASMVLRAGRLAQAGPMSVVFVTADDSAARATADLAGAAPFAILMVLVVGTPIAWLLARSVASPLRRLSAATRRLASGTPDPLPIEGPTEVQELTANFNRLSAELASVRQYEIDLLANLRHDLRTPLTVIGGFANALADGTATGANAGHAARVIGGEAERLERLVAELGAIERLRSGTDGLHPEQLDARDVIASTVERFGSRAESMGVDLTTDPSAATGDTDAGLTFAADRLAVERILANLVDNALRVAPSPGGHIWIAARDVGLDDDGSPAIAISVSDDGAGFPPGAAERAFDRFYRADPSRTGTGSGLGLAIVDELVRAHGGSAHAENVAPHGARVSVIFPVVPVPTRPP
jgi:two-component system OmpR family sensor kinase